MHCGTCGTALPEGAKFCGACGTTQAAPAPAPAPVPFHAPAEAAPAYQEPAAQPVFQEQPAYQAPPAPVYQEQPVYQAPPAAAAPAFQQQPAYQQQPAAPVYQQQPAYQPAAATPAAAAPAAAPAEAPPPKGSIYAPISGLGYIGYFILFAIPIVGQILCIAFAFSKSGNVNRRNLARAMFVMLIIGVILALAIGIPTAVMARRIMNDPSLAQEGIFSVIPGLGSGGGSSSGFPFSFGGGGEGGGSEGFFSEGGDFDPSPQGEGGGSGGNNDPANMEQGFNQLGQMFGGGWPENEFTKQVPKPNFEVSFGGVSENEFSALGGGATVDQLRNYAKELQKAGFNKNVETEDQGMFGMTTYSFRADNGKGYQVEISYISLMNINTITIRKI